MPSTTHAYEVGQTVFHVMGDEPGVIIGFMKFGEASGPIRYTVVWAGMREESDHYEIELTDEPPFQPPSGGRYAEGQDG